MSNRLNSDAAHVIVSFKKKKEVWISNYNSTSSFTLFNIPPAESNTNICIFP